MVRMYVMIVSSYLKGQLRILSGRSLFQECCLPVVMCTVDTVSEIDGYAPISTSRSLKLNLVSTT